MISVGEDAYQNYAIFIQTQVKSFYFIFQMQGSENHIIHIYGFDEKLGIKEKQLVTHLQKALEPYIDNLPEIKIRGRPTRYWAYISVNSQQAQKLEQLKTIDVAGTQAMIGRYYEDHQIFINKLDKSMSKQKIKQYFSKFGNIVNVVTTVPESAPYQHCYIKVDNEDTANRIILQKHDLNKQAKVVRTFKLDEDKDSDKKLFLKIGGNIPLFDQFEEKAIKYFSGFGTLRERPKLEQFASSKTKMIVTYTNPKNAASVLNQYAKSEWYKECTSTLVITLNQFYSKENKIFVKGLKETSEAAVMEGFEVFGPISDITVSKNRNSPGMSAIIGFKDEFGYKNSLANYLDEKRISQLFMGKPNVNVFLPPQDQRNFRKFKVDYKSKMQNPMMMMPMQMQINMQIPPNMSPMNMGNQPPSGMNHQPPMIGMGNQPQMMQNQVPWGMRGPNPLYQGPPPPKNYPK